MLTQLVAYLPAANSLATNSPGTNSLARAENSLPTNSPGTNSLAANSLDANSPVLIH